MCTKLFSDELAWNPFCTIKPWQKLLFSWCSFCGSFSISVLFSCNPLRTVNSIICAVAEDFVYISYHLKGVYEWSINPAYIWWSFSDDIIWRSPKKIILLFCLLKKNLHFCNKKNRQPQKHAKVTYTHMYKQLKERHDELAQWRNTLEKRQQEFLSLI